MFCQVTQIPGGPPVALWIQSLVPESPDLVDVGRVALVALRKGMRLGPFGSAGNLP